VHASHISNRDALKTGDRVSFELVTDAGRRKPRADRVRVL
jgi:cold shock CspA family protein